MSGAANQGDFGSASITASQLLFDFGRTWAAKDVAKSSAEALKEVLEAQKLDISQLVKTQYYTLLLSKRLVEVNVTALERAEVNLRSAQGFFQVGTQPKSFVTRAEVDVANGRVNVIRAQNAVSLARVALNTAMGIAVNAPTEVRDLLAYQQFPMNREDLVGEAIRNRPEYRQVRAQADAADAAVRQTFRDFFPNLFGSGTYGVTGVTGAPAFGSRTTNGFVDSGNEWTVGLSLNWSIFDGGAKVARYKEAKANLEAAQARVRDAELQVCRASSSRTSTWARPRSGSAPRERRWSRPRRTTSSPGDGSTRASPTSSSSPTPSSPSPRPSPPRPRPSRTTASPSPTWSGPWGAARNTARAARVRSS
jgi:outer membrane protein TolC